MSVTNSVIQLSFHGLHRFRLPALETTRRRDARKGCRFCRSSPLRGIFARRIRERPRIRRAMVRSYSRGSDRPNFCPSLAIIKNAARRNGEKFEGSRPRILNRAVKLLPPPSPEKDTRALYLVAGHSPLNYDRVLRIIIAIIYFNWIFTSVENGIGNTDLIIIFEGDISKSNMHDVWCDG